MQRTKIEWVKSPDGSQGCSWNPVRGLCLNECRLPDGRIYCYARRYYQRYGWDPTLRLDKQELEKPLRRKKPSGFFISMMEIMHPEINIEWIDKIFEIIKSCQQHRFYILTKLPSDEIYIWIPENVWLGVSITSYRDINKISTLKIAEAKISFISFEPLLDKVPLQYTNLLGIDWIIIGRLTGFGNKYDPKREWVEEIIEQARKYKIPIFLKDNMEELLIKWRIPKVQEFPRMSDV